LRNLLQSTIKYFVCVIKLKDAVAVCLTCLQSTIKYFVCVIINMSLKGLLG